MSKDIYAVDNTGRICQHIQFVLNADKSLDMHTTETDCINLDVQSEPVFIVAMENLQSYIVSTIEELTNE